MVITKSTGVASGPESEGPSIGALTHPARPRWHLPREGWGWLAIVGFLLSVGIIRNINLLALFGSILLAFFVVQALAVGRGLSRLQARRWTDEVFRQGVPCRVEVRLSNKSSRAVRGVLVEESDQPLHWYIDRVEAHGRYVCRGEVVPAKRGWLEFGSLIAESGHPFGLVRCRVWLCEGLRVLVLPRPGRLSREQFRRHLRGGDPRGERSRQAGARHELARADFHGLRSYRAGDSLRWIHWRTSARRGKLMVKEFEDVPGEDLVVVFDPIGEAGPVFEQAVSLVATIAHEWCQRRGDRLLVAVAGSVSCIEEGLTGPELNRRVQEMLALIVPETASYPYPEEAPVSSWPLGGSGVVGQATRPPADLLLGERLRPLVPRTASAILVATGDKNGALITSLEDQLARTVTLLDASDLDKLTFYAAPEKST